MLERTRRNTCDCNFVYTILYSRSTDFPDCKQVRGTGTIQGFGKKEPKHSHCVGVPYHTSMVPYHCVNSPGQGHHIQS